MTLIRTNFPLAGIMVMLWCSSAYGQPSSLSDLQSTSDHVRIAAFYALMGAPTASRFNAEESTSQLLRNHPLEQAKFKTALIDLLVHENVRALRPFDETFSNYYADLIWSVASLRDALAIDSLLGAVHTGNLATEGLAELGDVALPSVLLALETTDKDVRNGVLRVLVKLARPSAQSSLSADSNLRVRAALLRGTEDADAFNREVAIRGLMHFHDATVRSAVLKSVDDASERVRDVAAEWFRLHPLQ